MKTECCVIELDGRAYVLRDGKVASVRPDASDLETWLAQADAIVTDYRGVPQLREVCGRSRYAASLLAKELRDEGEAVHGSVLLVADKRRIDERCSRLLYDVLDRPLYKRYTNMTEASAKSCLLHSLGAWYAAAARRTPGCTLLVFLHHGTVDLAVAERGTIVAFRRVAGLLEEDGGDHGLDRLEEHVMALQQQLRLPLEQMAALSFLRREGGEEAAWLERAVARLGLPRLNWPSTSYEFEGETCHSEWLPLLRRLPILRSSGPRRIRLMAASAVAAPFAAGAPVVATVAMLAVALLARSDVAELNARVAALEAELDVAAEQVEAAIPEYQPYLANVEELERVNVLPPYETVLAELAGTLAPGSGIQLDGVRLDYPGDGPPPAAARRRGGAPDAGDPGVRARLFGRLEGDPLAAMESLGRLLRRMETAGFSVIDSDIVPGPRASDFFMHLRREPR